MGMALVFLPGGMDLIQGICWGRSSLGDVRKDAI